MKTPKSGLVLLSLASCFALAACGNKNAEETRTGATAKNTTETVAVAEPKATAVPRADWNRIAAEQNLPLFWTEDANKNGVIDPSELSIYWGLVPDARIEDYRDKDGFTAAFTRANERIAKVHAHGSKEEPGLDPQEAARRAVVRKELAQGRVTLVATDLTGVSPEEKSFLAHLDTAARRIEVLYAKQQGTFELEGKVPPADPASKTLFFRNQGPKCEAPLTEKDPNCNAIPNGPTGKLSGLYPAAMLQTDKFCEALSKADAGKKDKTVTDPFTVVTGTVAAPKAVPYHEAYKDDMAAVAAELKAAAGDLAKLGAKEAALKDYLLAAAQAFTDDKWWPADEAWAKMNAQNSRYYLRIAPDEVYAEPCSTKALFHVSFGLINQGSLAWQKKLDPLKKDMEKALAELAGPPYTAREVSFKLPDFVDIALNAGDSRNPSGATIGQSLPNFGPVANGGRGRTVAMTNFYTDPDSIASLEATSASLLCKGTMATYTSDPEPLLMSTVLHEAAHNLGPAHQYKAFGKIDREAFGGPLASTLEELKAQTAALYFTDWLAQRNQVDHELARKAHLRDVVWAFGHISRGMYDENKHPKNYSQLAAIQLGYLMDKGVVAWNATEIAANGKDTGCFSVALEKMAPAVKDLMTEVAHIKGAGDKTAADKLIASYVDVTGEKKKVHDVITERQLRAPKASFVYDLRTK